MSAYNFNKQQGRISPTLSIEGFLSEIECQNDFFSCKFDNHFLLASDIVPEGFKVFRLEDGFLEMERWLGEITNGELIISIGHEYKSVANKILSSNTAVGKLKEYFQPTITKNSKLTERIEKRIKNLYAEDYDRFY
jgi:hypothetical protein